MNGRKKGISALILALLVVMSMVAMMSTAAGVTNGNYCISGYKFDANNNPIEDWVIYVSYKNFLGGEEFVNSSFTNDTGYWEFCFEELISVYYNITEEEPGGWTRIYPIKGFYNVSVTEFNGGNSVTGLNFTNEEVTFAPGTGTPGYWKNHPDAWPVDEITIGGETYTKAEAITLMNTPEKGDKTYTMFRALVCAKLNVLIGNDDSCITDTIAAADAWMAYHPIGSGVKGNSDAWKEGEPLYELLDDYNNGELCAPHRDDSLDNGTGTGTSATDTTVDTTIQEKGKGKGKKPKK